jgi:hypothetical protein
LLQQLLSASLSLFTTEPNSKNIKHTHAGRFHTYIPLTTMKFLALAALGLAPVATAHTLFTTFFINGRNQGDGTCVRQPTDGSTSTSPIYPLNGDVMACGK